MLTQTPRDLVDESTQIHAMAWFSVCRNLRRRPLSLLGFAFIAGCSAQVKEATCPPLPPPTTESAPSSQRIAGPYVPSDAAVRASWQLDLDAADGQGGVLAAGIRVASDGTRSLVVAEPPLKGGARLPPHLGGSFVFWSSNALFFSRSLTGRLEPLGLFPDGLQVGRASFGPDFVLLHGKDGARVAWSVTKRERARMPVPGLLDVAAFGDGRAAMLVEPGKVLLRRAREKEFKDFVVPDSVSIDGLRVAGDLLWLLQTGGSAIRIGSSGAPVEFIAAPKHLGTDVALSQDSRWPALFKESPRERAIRHGHPLASSRALGPVQGGFAQVDLATGAIVKLVPTLPGTRTDCSIVPMSTDVLAVCWVEGRAVVVAGADTERPRIERTFVPRARFFAGTPDALVKDGPCDGPPDPKRIAVCVREKSGTWKELVRPRENGAPPSEFLRWIPTPDGGALGLVAGKQPGVLDVGRGKFTAITDSLGLWHRLEVSGQVTLADSAAVLPDGTIVGYVATTSIRITPDGHFQPSARAFEGGVQVAGPYAVAMDRGRGLWQSTDFGQHWAPVAGPPGFDASKGSTPRACSRVGCDFGDWYRVGYPADPPEALPPPEIAGTPVALDVPAPRITCDPTGPAVMRTAPEVLLRDGTPLQVADMGARPTPLGGRTDVINVTYESRFGGQDLLQATMMVETSLQSASTPAYAEASRRPIYLRFRELFGEPRVAESVLGWQGVRQASNAHTLDPNPTLSMSGGHAVPVLSPIAGTSSGMILDDEPRLFSVREGRPLEVLWPMANWNGHSPGAAYSRGAGDLVVLWQDSQTDSRIQAMQGKSWRVLGDLPWSSRDRKDLIHPDALAIGADGTIGVLRIPSFDPPTTDDPALVLVPGRAPIRLAPWSTLSAASDCVPGGTAFRAIVTTGPGWIDLTLGGVRPEAPLVAQLIVGWSDQRICLEAIEVATGSLSVPNHDAERALFARFVGTPRATHHGFGHGIEYVEPMACRWVGWR
jgi:hypothetical protein